MSFFEVLFLILSSSSEEGDDLSEAFSLKVFKVTPKEGARLKPCRFIVSSQDESDRLIR
jgi:hypothetical protein